MPRRDPIYPIGYPTGAGRTDAPGDESCAYPFGHQGSSGKMMHGWKAGVTEFDFMGSPVMAMRRTVTMTSLMAELPERFVDHRWRAPATR